MTSTSRSLTQEALMTLDRSGGIVYNAIEGETRAYNGVDYFYTGIADLTVNYDETADITTYTAKLKDGVLFSDGVPMTADDLIFSYYVFLDPSYTGSTQLASFNIIGVDEYRTQTTSDVYAKYADLGVAIYDAGKDHVWTRGRHLDRRRADRLLGESGNQLESRRHQDYPDLPDRPMPTYVPSTMSA